MVTAVEADRDILAEMGWYLNEEVEGFNRICCVEKLQSPKYILQTRENARVSFRFVILFVHFIMGCSSSTDKVQLPFFSHLF